MFKPIAVLFFAISFFQSHGQTQTDFDREIKKVRKNIHINIANNLDIFYENDTLCTVSWIILKRKSNDSSSVFFHTKNHNLEKDFNFFNKGIYSVKWDVIEPHYENVIIVQEVFVKKNNINAACIIDDEILNSVFSQQSIFFGNKVIYLTPLVEIVYKPSK